MAYLTLKDEAEKRLEDITLQMDILLDLESESVDAKETYKKFGTVWRALGDFEIHFAY